jgi:hypothetical protein
MLIGESGHAQALSGNNKLEREKIEYESTCARLARLLGLRSLSCFGVGEPCVLAVRYSADMDSVGSVDWNAADTSAKLVWTCGSLVTTHASFAITVDSSGVHLSVSSRIMSRSSTSKLDIRRID